MKRKVIQLAGKTHVVSLPSTWVKRNGILKGQDLDVSEQGDSLRISTDSLAMQGSVSVDISGTHPMIKRILGALYKIGYVCLEIQFSTPEEMAVVQEVIREEFVGFEVFHQGKNNITAKQISLIQPQEFGAMLSRIFAIIISTGSDSLEAYINKDKGWQKTIVMRDKDINKIADFCRRSLNTKGFANQDRTAPMYFIVEQLEKIGDMYRDLAQHLSEGPVEPKRNIKMLWSEVNSFFAQLFSLHQKFSIEGVSEFARKRYKLRPELQQLMQKSKSEDAVILMYLYMILEGTFDINGPLMAVNL